MHVLHLILGSFNTSVKSHLLMKLISKKILTKAPLSIFNSFLNAYGTRPNKIIILISILSLFFFSTFFLFVEKIREGEYQSEHGERRQPRSSTMRVRGSWGIESSLASERKQDLLKRGHQDGGGIRLDGGWIAGEPRERDRRADREKPMEFRSFFLSRPKRWVLQQRSRSLWVFMFCLND